MIITCPFCAQDQAVYYTGKTRCPMCSRPFYVERSGNAYTVLALVDELQPRFIGYEQVHPNAQPPTRATQRSTGYDLAVVEGGLVWPGFARVFDTGLKVYMAPDQHIDLRQRSGWFRKGLVLNPGLIDPDFRETIKILCCNVRPWPIKVRPGDRLAQVVLPDGVLFTQHGAPYPILAPIMGRERIGGLGSTGR